jgi:hypothetical protein
MSIMRHPDWEGADRLRVRRQPFVDSFVAVFRFFVNRASPESMRLRKLEKPAKTPRGWPAPSLALNISTYVKRWQKVEGKKWPPTAGT